MAASSTDSDTEDEQGLIEYYFSTGYQYKTIVDFLSKRHGIDISQRKLRNRLKQYDLCRRTPDFDINDIRRVVQDKLNGPGNLGGYRSMWHALRTEGHQVPRRIVQQLMRDLNPERCEIRRAKRLPRRTYCVLDPISAGIGTGTIS